MNADHTLDVSAIREAAEKATPGPWRTWNDGHVGAPEHHIGGIVMPTEGSRMDQRMPDADYIATMDPPTTLALLDALDAARAEVERLRIGLDGAHGNADRMRKSLLDERDAIAEKIAVAIEAEMRRHDGAQIGFSGKGDTYAHAARIAREVGKA